MTQLQKGCNKNNSSVGRHYLTAVWCESFTTTYIGWMCHVTTHLSCGCWFTNGARRYGRHHRLQVWVG